MIGGVGGMWCQFDECGGDGVMYVMWSVLRTEDMGDAGSACSRTLRGMGGLARGGKLVVGAPSQ